MSTDFATEPDYDSAVAWARESLIANFATSRGADFLARLSFPWSGQERAVNDALEQLYRDQLRLDATSRPPLDTTKIEASMDAALDQPGSGSDALAWLEALPVEGSTSRHGCAFYWSSVFYSTLGSDGWHIDGVRPQLWRAFVAAIRREAYDGAPEYAQSHAAYLAETEPVERIDAELRDWQLGPFSDWDLELAEAYEWNVADGHMWHAWRSILAYQRITTLWRLFSPHFSKDELDAVVAWKRGHGAALQNEGSDPDLDALLMDPVMAAVLADVADKTPPCHPTDILASDA